MFSCSVAQLEGCGWDGEPAACGGASLQGGRDGAHSEDISLWSN